MGLLAGSWLGGAGQAAAAGAFAGRAACVRRLLPLDLGRIL